MNITDVVAALIWRERRVLIARRAPGQRHAGGWEFPGGKVETGENRESALARELKEELHIDARIGSLFAESQFDYDNGTILLSAFHIRSFSGEIQMTVHDRVTFCTPGELENFDLLPADRPIAGLLKKNDADSMPVMEKT